MARITLLLTALLPLLPLQAASAGALRLPALPSSVEVPAAGPAEENPGALELEYEEFYSALRVYSEVAYVSPQDSPAFLEASAAGQYLRGRLEEMGRRIERLTGRGYAPVMSVRREISFRVRNELDGVFGFYGYGALEDRPEEDRGVVIKQGYCQVNYVKNNVPFLVQSDAFLRQGEVILTFDDGPGQFTEEVSSTMKEGGAPSVFFVLGSKLGAAGKERIRRAAADGHEVAVHGYHHATESGKPFTALSQEETLRQLSLVRGAIKSSVGRRPDFFRPPYGIISPEALKAVISDLELVPVGWTIDTLDWSTKDPEELFNRTVSMLSRRGKGIVLLHDVHDQSRLASARLVKWLAENGFKAVSPERLTQAFRGE
ncbi:MAG: polysaccharide deacetylase family protein [Elusimicrobia bacterium]|nr:polysaccharide deacetylase family protein [Elusimicrobiota bacterium]